MYCLRALNQLIPFLAISLKDFILVGYLSYVRGSGNLKDLKQIYVTGFGNVEFFTLQYPIILF